MIRHTATAVLAALCLAVTLAPAEAGFTRANKSERAAAHSMCPLTWLHRDRAKAAPAKPAKVAKAKAAPAPKKEASLKDTKPAKPAKAAKAKKA
jgi:hypothetical protein